MINAMGYTSVEKIILSKTENKTIKPNEFVYAKVDLTMANDVTALQAFDVLTGEMETQKVWDNSKVKIVYDHYFPANNVNNANVISRIRKICKEQSIEFFENKGICHQIMLENFVLPGQIVVGADSHTCTYGCIGALGLGVGSTDLAGVFAMGKIWLKVPETVKIVLRGEFKKGIYAKDIILKIIGDYTSSGFNYEIMEFSGEVVEKMDISQRATICNMVVEGGAKSSFIEPDNKTIDFIKRHANSTDAKLVKSDKDAQYKDILEYDVTSLEPMIACPHTVDNVKPLREIEGLEINQAFLGSCTNGRIEDLKIAASIIKGKKISDNIRMLVVPASVSVLSQAIKEGLIEEFLKFGAIINHPCCSNCWGVCQAILGDCERQISSANRNFKGRNGSPSSETYLASPAAVAASALTGKITDPRNFVKL